MYYHFGFMVISIALFGLSTDVADVPAVGCFNNSLMRAFHQGTATQAGTPQVLTNRRGRPLTPSQQHWVFLCSEAQYSPRYGRASAWTTQRFDGPPIEDESSIKRKCR
jgi:hypothetical protein